MGSPSVGGVGMCVDQGVEFGDRGGDVLNSVKCVSPCRWHPVDGPFIFLSLGRQHGQRDAFGLASCRHTALNAGPLVAVRVLIGTASPGARAFRAPERHTASGLRVRRCV